MDDRWTDEELAEKIKGNPDLRFDAASWPVSPFNITSGMTIKKEKKRHKFGVAPKEDRTYNGVVYHSKREAELAQGLDTRKKAGNIDFWIRQIPFPLPGDTVYRLDFMTFKHVTNCHWEVEFLEVKGYETRLGKLKRRLCEETYGIKITVVR